MNVHHHSSLSHLQTASPLAVAPGVEEQVLSSEQLLRGHREILIRHGDKLYRLRHTSNDKLILTK
ncbi:hemin uptake protein HemP [Pseudoxanthomonas sp. NC8]|nr:hemin uptake protein HemP [Pseudoxanthomonas sp. NC8]